MADGVIRLMLWMYRTLLEGALPEVVKVEDSMWTLESGKTVVITLDKAKKNWWRSVIVVSDGHGRT